MASLLKVHDLATSSSDATNLIEKLESCSKGPKKNRIFRSALYSPENFPCEVRSWSCQDFNYKNAKLNLPTLARGLFISEESDSKIVVRGYDKFFNVGEIPECTWERLEQYTQGPYEVTLKENGCIIFASCYKGSLIVTSKHSIGNEHSVRGKEWLLKHLTRVNSTMEELSTFLESENLTAVFEVCL
jgi:tRNA ligase